MLYTNGLKLSDKEGTIFASDETRKVTAMLGDIIIFDANNNRSMDGSITYSMVRENEEYLLTVHVSEDYLSADTTAYPIRIDPTITINYTNSGSGAIEDGTLYKINSVDMTGSTLKAGRVSTSDRGRIILRYPGNNLKVIHSANNVSSARVELQDIGLSSDTVRISCFCIEDDWPANPAWGSPNTNLRGKQQSYNDVSYSNGLNQNTAHRYRFDITDAVKNGRMQKTKAGFLMEIPMNCRQQLFPEHLIS